MKFNDRSMALLGVPDLPLNAFVRKVGGGIVPQGGGSTTNTTTQSTELPPWLKQYAEKGLKKAEELTSQPYQPFEGERIAGFSPLQLKTQEAAGAMTPATTTGGTFDQGAAGQYMNPYMQSVVDIQKREAQRGADIAGTQRGAQAAQAGAFGGSRQAIMDAEAARNLATQQGDIQAQGSNLAFQQAQQQFNADQERRLRAEGQGFQQGMDVNRLQNAYGAQQQALRQQGLTQSYEDFQRQQQDPYNKLSFMSSMVRGTPGMISTTTGTTPNPSFLQTAGSLATTAYGLSKFMAEGGSVDSQQNVESIVHTLSNKQLDAAEQAAKVRGDGVQLRAIAMEKAARASEKRGIAAVPVDMDKMMPTAEGMARGGIVAFAEGGGSAEENEDDEYPAWAGGTESQGPGNSEMYSTALNEGVQAESAVRNAKRTPFTPEMRAAQIKRTRAELMEGMGPSPYEAQRKEFEQMKADSAKNLEQSKGLAALQAASAMLQGGNAIRGLAAGASTFGSAYGEAVRADQAQKRALQSMRINLIDAERKEKMGLNKEAIASANQAQKDQNAADVFEIDKNKALANLAYRKAAATKPGPAAKPAPEPKLDEATLRDLTRTLMAKTPVIPGESTEDRQNRLGAQAGMQILGIKGARTSSTVSDVGETRAKIMGSDLNITATKAASADAQAAIQKLARRDEAYRTATPEVRARMEQKVTDSARAAYGLSPLGAAAPAAPAAAPRAVPAAQIPAGVTYGKVVAGKGTEVIKGGKVIGYAN